MARAASGCRWNETSADDDQRQTEDDQLRKTRIRALADEDLLQLHFADYNVAI